MRRPDPVYMHSWLARDKSDKRSTIMNRAAMRYLGPEEKFDIGSLMFSSSNAGFSKFKVWVRTHTLPGEF